MKIIYFAGGCFWGVEKYFKMIDGVIETNVGYANGLTKTTTYKEVCTGETNHVETVKVYYDETKVSLERLIDLFFKIIDPTSLNKQGEDEGTQYRSGIYYLNEADKSIIENKLKDLQATCSQKIVVENLPLSVYINAEDYHQDYLDKNPEGYCHIDFTKIII